MCIMEITSIYAYILKKVRLLMLKKVMLIKKNSYEEFLRINKFAGNYNRKNRDLFLVNLSLVRKILLRILLILKTGVTH